MVVLKYWLTMTFEMLAAVLLTAIFLILGKPVVKCVFVAEVIDFVSVAEVIRFVSVGEVVLEREREVAELVLGGFEVVELDLLDECEIVELVAECGREVEELVLVRESEVAEVVLRGCKVVELDLLDEREIVELVAERGREVADLVVGGCEVGGFVL